MHFVFTHIYIDINFAFTANKQIKTPRENIFGRLYSAGHYLNVAMLIKEA